MKILPITIVILGLTAYISFDHNTRLRALEERQEQADTVLVETKKDLARVDASLQLVSRPLWFVRSGSSVSPSRSSGIMDSVSVDLAQTSLGGEADAYVGKWVRFTLKTGLKRYTGEYDDVADLVDAELAN
jgi:hypothetical protein